MKKIKGPKLSDNELVSAKVRITTYLDEDIINKLRLLAKNDGGKYQTVLNKVLREHLFAKNSSLINRIEKLEQAVFKKKAA